MVSKSFIDKILKKTGWKRTYKSRKIEKFANDWEIIEIYSERIRTKTIWFVDVLHKFGSAIGSEEFNSREKAYDGAINYMLNYPVEAEYDEVFPSQTADMKL